MDKTKVHRIKSVLSSLDEEVEFFFSAFFNGTYPSIYRDELYWKPPTDVYETDEAFVVVVELANMKSDEVSISYQDGILTIHGVRQAEAPSEQRRYHKMEINYGPFERKVDIPEDVEIEKLTAKYEFGFLEIKLPKRGRNSGKIIEVEVE
ncbi:Hsp20/alpha crystallin family protein [bacterium]|nr:Hsp20/alpha crystallin family protein [bacterium]